MDEKERDEILYRLDERTKRVDDHLNRLDKKVAENQKTLENHEERLTNAESFLDTSWKAVKRVGALLTAIVSGIGAAVLDII